MKAHHHERRPGPSGPGRRSVVRACRERSGLDQKPIPPMSSPPAGIGGAVALVLAGLDAALFFAFTVPIGTALVILGYHLRSAATETSAEPSPTSEKEIQTE